MRRAWIVAKMLLSFGAGALVFSLQAVTHDVTKAWRCRPDSYATAYEHADACRSESWR